jgi:ATP-dependent DNA helicase DinG
LSLNAEKILALLEEGSALAIRLKNFEKRDGQKHILEKMVEAFNSKAVALIEAGTGSGKSIAYLIPALIAAAYNKERVVISTHTISLQEQLLYKDIPALTQALGIDIKAVLVKGMGNYVCLRKCEEMALEKKYFTPQEQEILDKIESSAKEHGKGEKSRLPFNPPPALWEMVAAEHDACSGAQCPFYSQCPYIHARKTIQDAQLLVVNHHLLFADLALRAETNNYTNPAILPPYKRVILDEAHHIEDIATGFFAHRFSKLEIFKILWKSAPVKQGKFSGKLARLVEQLLKILPEGIISIPTPIPGLLSIELPDLHASLLKELDNAFHHLEQFLETQEKRLNLEENKLRLRKAHYSLESWQKWIKPSCVSLSDLLRRYASGLNTLVFHLEKWNEERKNESIKGFLFDLKGLSGQLEKASVSIVAFSEDSKETGRIRWIESNLTKRGMNLVCIDAVLDVSPLIFQHLCRPFDTVAFLSATLSTQGSFAYIKGRFGISQKALDNRKLIEISVASPFDYHNQALLVIPKDIPAPNDPKFLPHAAETIWSALQASRGNAFILFTSYEALKNCYILLKERLESHRFFPLKQGDDHRQNLLKQFISKDRSVLFGTDSFWEGVDVVGEALRLVVIAKLPFKVPTEPLIQARSEALIESGKEPFSDLLLPLAAIKLKQGFGRLIRNKKDRGCILCLDNRLVTKNYGKYLIKTLPDCPCAVVETGSLKDTMSGFYRKSQPSKRIACIG